MPLMPPLKHILPIAFKPEPLPGNHLVADKMIRPIQGVPRATTIAQLDRQAREAAALVARTEARSVYNDDLEARRREAIARRQAAQAEPATTRTVIHRAGLYRKVGI